MVDVLYLAILLNSVTVMKDASLLTQLWFSSNDDTRLVCLGLKKLIVRFGFPDLT